MIELIDKEEVITLLEELKKECVEKILYTFSTKEGVGIKIDRLINKIYDV